MKKILIFMMLFVVLAVGSLAVSEAKSSNTHNACDSEFYMVSKEKMHNGDAIIILLDRATGVEYIAYKEKKRGIRGLCPRYQPDGTLFKAE